MIIKSPHNISIRDFNKNTIFLGGSIEMGLAENWQEEIENAFSRSGKWVVFNPRRDDWDSSWVQDFSNPQFSQQVNWELDALEKADSVLIYFDPATRSPISLLELGLFAQSGKLTVICPHGFWRKGNVDIVCNRYNVRMFETIEDFMSAHFPNINRLKDE
jgi:hypothetical protein